jgi:hypothetical protein
LVTTHPFGTDDVLVAVRAPILTGSTWLAPHAQALNLVPSLNASHRLFEFLLGKDGGLIGVYGFLGSSLRSGPLVATIRLLAGIAELIGTQFVEELGGQLDPSVIAGTGSR